MNVAFTKMQSIGNDFIILNQIKESLNIDPKKITELADRNFGIGFDQLLIIEKSKNPDIDFKYRIFNSDGSEVEHCGNGARCFFHYVQQKKLIHKETITVETSNQIIKLFKKNNLVHVDMGSYDIPKPITKEPLKFEIFFQKSSATKEGFLVNLGNPHIVFFLETLSILDVERTGQSIQNSDFFQNSINVGFCHIKEKNHIDLVVYERGSGLTLGCGSGACAATVAGINNGLLDHQEINIKMPGGYLKAEITSNQHIILKGDAHIVFEGIINL